MTTNPTESVLPKSSRCLVIAGAGDLGGRLARRRAAFGDDVIALRRSDRQIPGARLLRVNLANGDGYAALPRRPDALVFCAAPDQRNEVAYRALYLDGLRRLLDVLQVARVIFVSSTAVYAEDAGEWVDELTPPGAQTFNARILREAEHEISRHVAGSVLRLSGIYGPGRELMLRRAREGTANRQHWSNRIHVEDAAAALSNLLDLAAVQPLYLGSDDQPVIEAELQAWVRRQEGLSEIAPLPGLASGRRIANARLRASGWLPSYPDFRSGYAEFLTPVSV